VQSEYDEGYEMPEEALMAVLEGVLEELDAEEEEGLDMEVDLPVVHVDALIRSSGASSSAARSQAPGNIPAAPVVLTGESSSASSSSSTTADAAEPFEPAVVGHGRGYGKGAGAPYARSMIPDMDAPPGSGKFVGKILINVQGGSLDAHCDFCKARINRVAPGKQANTRNRDCLASHLS
jgi:hypothetical protein